MGTRTTRAAALALAISAASASAGVPAGADAQGTLALEDRAVLRLGEERTRQRAERIDAGVVLLVYGLASVVAGGVAAGVGHDDPRWLGAGLGTAGWGAVNAALALGLLDLGGGLARAIDADRAAVRGAARVRLRESLARDAYASATVFAVNAGLDVFYVAAGVMLAVIARLLDAPDPALEGYGIAMAAQGAGLLAFDVVEWVGSLDRADRLLALDREDPL